MKKWSKKLWHFFTSMRTGLLLLCLTALLSGIGTLIAQNNYVKILSELLFGLFCINLIVCSISRFDSTVKRAFHPSIPQDIRWIPRKISSSITSNSSDLRHQIERVLKTRGYRLSIRETADGWAFTALKHRLGYWGSYIAHIALITIIIGALMGGLGFSGGLVALSGETIKFNDIPLNKGTVVKNYSIRINSIEDRYLPNGEQDNWYTNISIIQSGKEIANGTLSVNHPFIYDGVYYYQAQYQDLANIIVIVDDKQFAYMIPLGLTQDEGTVKNDFKYSLGQKIQDSNWYIKGLKLKNKPVVYLEIYNPGKQEALLKLTKNQQVSIGNGYKITLENLTNATGLEVKADPGVPVIWLGCGMLLLGLLLSFYWRPLLVCGVFISREPTGTLFMGTPEGKLAGQNTTEFDNIIRYFRQTKPND
jgi:cytochrome c biogenesis protein